MKYLYSKTEYEFDLINLFEKGWGS